MSNVKRCPAIVKGGVVRVGGEVVDAVGVSLGKIVTVIGNYVEFVEACIDGGYPLVLMVDATGLELIDISVGGSERCVWIGVESRVEFWRADVVAHILMQSAAVEVGDVGGDFFGEAAVDTDGALDVQCGVEVWSYGVVDGGGVSRARRCRLCGIAWTGFSVGGVVDDVDLLIGRCSVGVLAIVDSLCDIGRSAKGVEGIRYGEALIEPAIARAQDGFGSPMCVVENVGEIDSRSPVALVVDIVLRFPANSVAKREVRRQLPIVLNE